MEIFLYFVKVIASSAAFLFRWDVAVALIISTTISLSMRDEIRYVLSALVVAVAYFLWIELIFWIYVNHGMHVLDMDEEVAFSFARTKTIVNYVLPIIAISAIGVFVAWRARRHEGAIFVAPSMMVMASIIAAVGFLGH